MTGYQYSKIKSIKTAVLTQLNGRKTRFPLLPWACAFFCGGLFASDAYSNEKYYIYFGLCSVFFSISFLMRKTNVFNYIMPIAFLFLGTGWMGVYNSKINNEHKTIQPFIANKTPIKITAQVINLPVISLKNSNPKSGLIYRSKFYAKIISSDPNIGVTPKILVYVYSKNEKASPNYKDTVTFTSNLVIPTKFKLNRVLNYRDYLSFYGISFTTKVEDGNDGFKIIKRTKLLHCLFKLREQMLENVNINRLTETEPVKLLKGMILGEKLHVDYSIINQFVSLGIIHILIISGAHLGYLAFFASTLSGFIGICGKKSKIVVIPVLVFYSCIVGFGVSVCRALLMLLFYYTADFMKRDRPALNALALSAVTQLLFLPKLIYDAGFQYSYISILSLVFIYPLFKDIIKPKRFWGISKYCFSALSIWLVVTPLIAYRDGYFFIYSLFLGLAVVFLSEIIIITGISAVTAGFFLKPVAECLNYFNFSIMSFIIYLSGLSNSAIFRPIYFFKIPGLWIALYLITIGLVLAFFKKTIQKIIIIAMLFAAIMLLGVI